MTPEELHAILRDQLSNPAPLRQLLQLCGNTLPNNSIPELMLPWSTIELQKDGVTIKRNDPKVELELAVLLGNLASIEFRYLRKTDDPSSIEAMLKGELDKLPLPDDFAKTLRQTECKEVYVLLSLTETAFVLALEGRLAGMLGAVRFAVLPGEDGKNIKIDFTCQPELQSLRDLLINKFGLLPAEVAPFLPQIKLALTALAYDQALGRFAISGKLAGGKGEKVYEVECGMDLKWQDPRRLELSFNAMEQPVRLDALLEDLGWDLSEMAKFLSVPVVERIGQTDLRSLDIGILLDKTTKSVSFQGVANLFGEWLIEISLEVAQEEQLHFMLDAQLYTEPRPVKKLLAEMGFPLSNEANLPELTIAPRRLLIDYKAGVFRIVGEAGGAKGTGLVTLDITVQKEEVLIDFSFEAAPAAALTLKDIAGNVLQNITFGSGFPEKLGERLEQSGLHAFHLMLHIAPEPALALQCSGTLLNIQGNAALQMAYTNGQLNTQFYLDIESSKPIRALLKDTLNVTLPEAIDTHLLPRVDYALQRVYFNQAQRAVGLAGTLLMDDVIVETSVDVHWDEFQLLFSARVNEETPLELNALLKRLPLHQELEKLLPGQLYRKIGETTFQSFELDISSTRFAIGGVCKLFGELLTDAAFELIRSGTGDTSFQFTVNAYGERQKISGLIKMLGVELPDVLPDVGFLISHLQFGNKSGFTLRGSAELYVKSLDLSLLLDENEFILKPSEKYLKLTSKANASVPIPLPGGEKITLSAALELERQEGQPLKALLEGKFEYGKIEFSTKLNIAKETTFTATAKNIGLADLVKKLTGSDLPEGVPHINVKELTFSLTSEKALTIKAVVDGKWNLPGGGTELVINTISFDFSRDKTGKIDCSLAVKGRLAIESAIVIDDYALTFDYAYDRSAKQSSWKVNNSFNASIFGHKLAVKAGYKQDKNTSLSFSVTDPFPAIELAGPAPAKFELKEVSLELKKDQKGNYTWDVSAKSNFETPLFTYEEGKISFYHKEKKTGLVFSAGKQDIRFINDEYTPYFTLENAKLEFLYDHSGKGSWACSGSSDIIAKQVPKQIGKLLPSTKVKAGFTIDSKVAEIKINYDGLFPIPLPPKVDGVDTSSLDLGELYIGIKGLALDFRNGGKLSATVGVGLPEQLNHIFKDANGKGIEVFRTYNPQTREGSLDFDFSISKKDGLGLQMKSSPFKLIANPGKDGYVIDLGEFGKVAFELPKFSLKGNSLKASGGFKILPDPKDPDKPRLYLPTSPIKHFLKAVGLDEVNKILVNKIPLDGVNFAPIVDGHRTFDSAAFLKKFTNSEVKPEQKLPDWIQKAFNTIDGIAGKLPDAFLEYGDLEMVDQFHFEIEMDTNCSLKCKFSVKDEEGNGKPLKLLLPQFPQLIGIKLKSFSFGQLFSGTLFRFDIDAEFDQFDIPQLLAALVLDPEHPLVKEYLANPKTFHNRFTLKELMVIIIYQTQIPIPIPLFYEEIGFSSITLSGTEAKGSLSFPFPSIGMNELKNCAVLVGELVGFFKDNKAINWQKIGEMDFIKFEIGPTYVKLPKYIATEKGSNEGKLIGTKEGIKDIGPLKILAAVMDAIQKQSINQLIRSVPLERRVNNFDLLLFGLLELECKYAFTTPFEFVDKAYDMLDIPEKTREEYIGLLPPRRVEIKQDQGGQDRTEPVTSETEGLVVFLNNKMSIGSAISFENGFGLMATAQGFGLGGLFKGKVGDDLFNVYLRGLFKVEKQGDIMLAGEGYLKLFKTNILAGAFRLNKDGLFMEAKVGDEQLPIQIEGRLEGTFRKDYFHLKGNGNLRILGLEIKANCESELLFSKEEEKIYLHGEYQLGDVSRLQSTLNYEKKGASTLMAVHFSGEVAKLFALTLNGNLLANKKSIEAFGDASMKIFDEEVLSAQFLYDGRALLFYGIIDLFPQHKAWIKVKGEADGSISNHAFYLDAKVEVEVMKQHFVESQLSVNNQEARIISRLFGLRTALFIQKEPGLQVIGSISPIVVGSFFSIKQKKNLGDTITQVTGGKELSLQERSETENKLSLLKGPSVVIGTQPTRFQLAGSSSLLGFESDTEIRFYDEPGKTGFEFECSGRAFNLIRTDLRVKGTMLTHNAALRLSGTIYFEELTEEICAEIRKAAQSVQDAMEKAKRDLAMANEALKRVADRIEEEVKKAIREYDENLKKALAWLEEKKGVVNSLEGKIKQYHQEIADLKQQIEAKRIWYEQSEWWQKSYRWVELGAVVAKLGLQIMERYAAIALLEGLRLTAVGLLELAEEGVRKLRAIGDASKWGLEQSVKALKEAADAALKRATDALIIAQNTVGVFEEWSKTAIRASAETFKIHNASFEADTPLHRITGGSVLIGVDVSFFGKRQTHTLAFNFANQSIGIAAMVDVLKKRKANPSELAIKAKKEGVPVLEAATKILTEYPDINPSQMSVALLRGDYDRREEVQKIALKQLYVDTGRAKPQEIVWAVKAGIEFIESANQIQR